MRFHVLLAVSALTYAAGESERGSNTVNDNCDDGAAIATTTIRTDEDAVALLQVKTSIAKDSEAKMKSTEAWAQKQVPNNAGRKNRMMQMFFDANDIISFCLEVGSWITGMAAITGGGLAFLMDVGGTMVHWATQDW
eukprot:gnl/TRDRNA2_/TRDRNA2_189015_c0_seq1.p2 gnl/TRDRNA2_/TRDRNA2_189015_c0~~gnl/TRDRNA2_/TRDRNA2_189015_c0_seq1.p2  ORF type:complete len:137 (-),score=28.72 gnl/TRDRNA2_/TRDRNA2_189015_c0_seq1:66-476(-)